MLLITGFIFIVVTGFTADMYVQEITQKVSRPIAGYIAKKANPFVGNRINAEVLSQLFENVSMINPGIEIYLLNPKGKILASSVPKDQVARKMISLDPINAFMNCGGNCFTLGDDPHSMSGQKVFSVTPVWQENQLKGFIYVILRGGEYDSATRMLLDSYILPLGLRGFVITLAIAAIMALLVLRLLTRKLRKMTRLANAFGQGDFSERIPVTSNDEIDAIAIAFNQMADTIVAHMEDMEKTDRLRRELIANVSHDLRTPLTSIQGYVETLLLKQGKLSESEQAKYLQIVLKGAQKLTGRVEELFELSKLEADQLVPCPEAFAITDLIQDVISKFKPEVDKRKIQLTSDFPINLPWVYADIGMIERVLQNLIDNAIRYTPENEKIHIQLTLDQPKITIQVADTGAGISSRDLPFIFDRFYRGEQHSTRNSRGSGLGLAIAYKIMELHNSKLSVESCLDQGSSFSFQLPPVQPDKIIT